MNYPLQFPAGRHIREIVWDPQTVVGYTASLWTGQPQTYVWPGQWWAAQVTLHPMRDPAKGLWEAFFLGLNGQQGWFNFGDPSRKVSRGNPTGTWLVGAGTVANTGILPTVGNGTLAVGDWIKVGPQFLHKVIRVVDEDHYEVWPRLRNAYPSDWEIIYTNPYGNFRLASNAMGWGIGVDRVASFQFNIIEAL